MIRRCMPNSDPWVPHMTAFIIIFMFFVSPPIPNIEKNDVYEDYKSWEVSHQIFIKFPFEWHRNHVWKPIFDPSYDDFHKCEHFGQF